jgi:hypothetical protein
LVIGGVKKGRIANILTKVSSLGAENSIASQSIPRNFQRLWFDPPPALNEGA